MIKNDAESIHEMLQDPNIEASSIKGMFWKLLKVRKNPRLKEMGRKIMERFVEKQDSSLWKVKRRHFFISTFSIPRPGKLGNAFSIFFKIF